jgi:hypothetical protein
LSFLTLRHVSWCVASQPSPPAAAKSLYFQGAGSAKNA